MRIASAIGWWALAVFCVFALWAGAKSFFEMLGAGACLAGVPTCLIMADRARKGSKAAPPKR